MGLFSFLFSSSNDSEEKQSADTEEQKRKKEDKKREWKDTNEKYKFVCEAGKVRCQYCSTPLSPIIVTSNDLSLQDIPHMTAADNNGKVNLNFTGDCLHPKAPKASGKPLPCKTLISLLQWKNTSQTFINNDLALIVDSKISCAISNSDLTIEHSGQKAVIYEVKPILPIITLLEKGIVRKGYWVQEGAKTIITNSKGERGYDWTYADAPSEELMKANGMTGYDVFNINLTKSYSEWDLKAEMKTTLWLSSDIEDGLGKNGLNLANHFFSGQGVPFTFEDGSNPSEEIKDSKRFKDTFLNSLKLELLSRYEKLGYVSQSAKQPYQFKTALPYYKATEAINPNVNEVAAFIGGIQGSEVEYYINEISIGNLKTKVVQINKVTFYDTFGAGWEDGGADGTMKQWIPGLVAMFCLQHFKNVKDKSKYQPFTVKVEIIL